MKLFTTIYISFFMCCSLIAVGQEASVRKADIKFSNLQYIDALNAYKAIIDNGYESEDVFQKLGDAYYFNANYTEAANYYSRLFDLNNNQAEIYQYRYGQSLKAIEGYKKADIYLGEYYKSKGIHFFNSESFVENIKKDPIQFKVEKATFNTKYSEYPGFIENKQLYIIAPNVDDMKNPWNGEPTTDIFISEGTSLSSLSTNLNTKYNEGSLVITKDSNTMYFTRNNYLGKLKTGANKLVSIKLYRANKIDGKWDNVIELPFNSNEYSVGHPALSNDEKTLYFVSDQPDDNKGGKDIYSVEILADGVFSQATNVSSLNTAGDEMFPFIDKEGTLYYSSNGFQNNLGGLDIYRATPSGTGFIEITNMGEPINSSFDDFAFVTNVKDENDNGNEIIGYLASNRNGSDSDDIYIVTPFCTQELAGTVKDKKTDENIPNATVMLINDKNEIVARMKSNESGYYKFENKGCDDSIKFVRAEKAKYQTNEVEVPADEEQRKKINVYLDLRELDVLTGRDIAKLLNPIYFDLDKSNIRPDAALELQKIVAILKQYPSINIDVRSHTDSRGNDNYNMALSERRAQSTINYLVKNGIDNKRLTGKGYGETQLVNGCSNGVKCSKAEQQRNRRSEFLIK